LTHRFDADQDGSISALLRNIWLADWARSESVARAIAGNPDCK